LFALKDFSEGWK